MSDIFEIALGDGPGLIVAHGGLGLDHTYFRPWLDGLADRYRVVFYDHRGNGRSARPADWNDLGADHLVADLESIRRRHGFDRFVLLAHSYSCFLALEYALKKGDRLAGMVLCCGTPTFDYPELIASNAQARATETQLGVLGSAFSGPVVTDEEFERIWKILLPLYFTNFGAEQLAAFRHTRYSAGAFNQGHFRWAPEFNYSARLPEIAVPTLIVSGDDDWIMPPSQGQRLAAIPHSTHVIMENCGHFPFIEKPAAFVNTVQPWIADRYAD